jgi:uncharacterized membrane protein
VPATTRLVGIALIAVGLVAFLASGADSPTALIPAALGVLLVVLGLVANRENARRHAMHAAMLVALLGIAGTAMNLGDLPQLFSGDAERPLAVVASALTAVVLLIYLVVGIRSFIAARQSSAA